MENRKRKLPHTTCLYNILCWVSAETQPLSVCPYTQHLVAKMELPLSPLPSLFLPSDPPIPWPRWYESFQMLVAAMGLTKARRRAMLIYRGETQPVSPCWTDILLPCSPDELYGYGHAKIGTVGRATFSVCYDSEALPAFTFQVSPPWAFPLQTTWVLFWYLWRGAGDGGEGMQDMAVRQMTM